ncbi:hypothetical protein JQ633_29260 [Bradyrhizobium tropiciagri]|uniref:hypothetical protein n=1 Tax=Bradyrhizobium tropiciagri TaxID=312253 RepID=UPI001BA73622|nr:hypothetical protein [Bradyrhizobium tropiciagri]MBR0874477.1 hypothetical protein [Bradyrhizobium tropiciagri]
MDKVVFYFVMGLFYFVEAIHAVGRFLSFYGPAILIFWLVAGAGVGLYLAATSKSQKKFF